MTSHTPNLINDVHIIHCSIILLSINWKHMKEVVVAKLNILFWYMLGGLHKTVIMTTHLQTGI